jgi:hypothetical protein
MLLVENVVSDVWFQNWVDMFHLVISFWIICGGESQLDSQSSAELLPEAA